MFEFIDINMQSDFVQASELTSMFYSQFVIFLRCFNFGFSSSSDLFSVNTDGIDPFECPIAEMNSDISGRKRVATFRAVKEILLLCAYTKILTAIIDLIKVNVIANLIRRRIHNEPVHISDAYRNAKLFRLIYSNLCENVSNTADSPLEVFEELKVHIVNQCNLVTIAKRNLFHIFPTKTKTAVNGLGSLICGLWTFGVSPIVKKFVYVCFMFIPKRIN